MTALTLYGLSGPMKSIFISESRLRQIHQKIETPALLVNEKQLDLNILGMQELANKYCVGLRPHFKTHKSVAIAHKQIKAGAIGITVAKTAEAEIIAAAGIEDIFIANQIMQPLKFERLLRLNKKIRLSVGVDHPEQVRILQSFFRQCGSRLRVRVEIDCGLKRCGVLPGKGMIDLVQKIKASSALEFDGIFTHAGQVYAAGTVDEVRKEGEHEARLMIESLHLLRESGIEAGTVSVGSTPTVPYSAAQPGITEIRPGNYVFYDNIQQILGSCRSDQWSLAVLATVISQPTDRRLVIDAGSKALNLDRGAHASERIRGYGKLLNIDGEIIRLSEEHGVIEVNQAESIQLGSPVLIIPNHACAVTNLFSQYYFLSGSKPPQMMPVDARGMSQ
jgi:D-serine deaminase-like pyridoxal phosphate-dependent protein